MRGVMFDAPFIASGGSMLTADMRAVIQSAHLCFAATVTPDGRPNVSPKGTIGVWDDTHLFFLDIASPGTRANLAHAPWLELNVVDQLSRRGYRFAGTAVLHLPESEVYAEGVRRVYDATLPADPPAGVVLLAVERAAPLLSPAYWRGDDETAIRALWRERRSELDREFDAHLAQVGAVRVNVG
jgi:predicted pyridoxine 5'-phosphate oxidase superfamily flavin-nucleotide-binding protein